MPLAGNLVVTISDKCWANGVGLQCSYSKGYVLPKRAMFYVKLLNIEEKFTQQDSRNMKAAMHPPNVLPTALISMSIAFA